MIYFLNIIILLFASESFGVIKDFLPDKTKDLAVVNRLLSEKILHDRASGRPRDCPLKSDFISFEIHQKLISISEALKYGACYDKNKHLIDGMNHLVSQAQRVNLPMGGGAGVNWHRDQQTISKNPTDQQKIALNSKSSSELLNTMSMLSKDDDCLYNVKQRGLLPVVADVATNMGQATAFVPSASGLMMSAGGIGFGAIIRIISGLFLSSFDWDIASERKQFLDLNCAFFDLRRDIEEAEVVDIHDESTEKRLEETKLGLRSLEQALREHTKKQSNFQRACRGIEDGVKQNGMGEDLFLLSKVLQKMSGAFPAEIKSDAWLFEFDKNRLIKALMDYGPEFLNLLPKDLEPPEYSRYLEEKIKKFKWENLSEFNDLASKDFWAHWGAPLQYYFNDYNTRLQRKLSQMGSSYALDYDLHRETNYPEKLNNSQLISKFNSMFESHRNIIMQSMIRLQAKIEILQSFKYSKSLSEFDHGAHGQFDLIQEYVKIQGLLYDKLGASFLKYFKGNIYRKKRSFNNSYKTFEKKYLKRKKIKTENIPWACRDAQQLRVVWEHANSSCEVAFDFLSTGVGYYHSDYSRYRTFFSFLPTGNHPQYKLYMDAHSAYLAKRIIAGEVVYREKDLDRYGKREESNLGKLFLSMDVTEYKRKQVEDFWQRHKCITYQ